MSEPRQEPVVREAEPGDVAEAAALRWTWIVEDQGRAGVLPRETFLAEFAAWARAHERTHRCFVAEVDGRVVGTAWLALVDRVPSPRALDRRTADVQSVYVLPTFRGRRVGAALIDAVVAAASAAGAERITVHSSESATGSYARAGFEPSELLRDRALHPVG